MKIRFTTILCLLAALGATVVSAQNIPYVKKGDFELGLFAGESYGLDRFRPMAGGNVAFALSRWCFPFAEGSYLPGILRRQNVPTGTTTSHREFSVDMTDFHAGLHIRHPRAESRLVPYGVIGLGMIRSGKNTGLISNVSALGVTQIEAPIPASTNFAVDFGAGLRYFFSQKIAVRIELKGFKPTSAPAPFDPRVFYRLAIGPIFQMR